MVRRLFGLILGFCCHMHSLLIRNKHPVLVLWCIFGEQHFVIFRVDLHYSLETLDLDVCLRSQENHTAYLEPGQRVVLGI